jgi:ribonuclease E
MLIDATHPEETRVAVISGNRLEEFDFESSTKQQLKGNIYLAKVVRVEPSLQAAFIDYGGSRHGFLAFSEIHPDYYQIPIADRQALIEADAEQAKEGDNGEDEALDVVGGDEAEELAERRPRPLRNYKIQEVIKRRQILLIQVVKEERGNKGAALTTYLSLAGRYCVLMPNTARGGGISRKISNPQDRKRLKAIIEELRIPGEMAVIVRTAGSERTKADLRRDYEYLIRLWDEIRERTLVSTAPTLIYEEANIIKRAIRDLYTKDIDEIVVDGDQNYKMAKDFMKKVIPSHAKKVQPYRDPSMPMFHRYKIESQLDAIHNPTVQLKSGGYIVLSPTEALVSIDVNSGRATRERHIEETALKTNVEAADEIARQLRLRDLAGLIVIDFIDMEEKKNVVAVERRLKEAMRNDRARIQIGRISLFGLLELSRQRLRPSLVEASTQPCPSCGGSGHIRSTESASLYVLRAIEEEALRRRSAGMTVHVASAVALYVLNQKRDRLREIEIRYGHRVLLASDDELVPPDFRLERVKAEAAEADRPPPAAAEAEEPAAAEAAEEEAGRRQRKPRRRRSKRDEPVAAAADAEPDTAAAAELPDEPPVTEEAPRKRRRRGRRGGRGRARREDTAGTEAAETEAQPLLLDGDSLDQGHGGPQPEPAVEPAVTEPGADDREKPVTGRRRRKAKVEAVAEAETVDAEVAARPKRHTRRRPRQPAEAAADRKDGDNGAAPAEPAEATAPTEPAAPVVVPEPGPAMPEPPIVVAAKPSEAASAVEDAETPKPPPESRRRGWWQRLTE